jgi:hypothetical protein
MEILLIRDGQLPQPLHGDDGEAALKHGVVRRLCARAEPALPEQLTKACIFVGRCLHSEQEDHSLQHQELHGGTNNNGGICGG